jgi:hypothetical protein
VDDGVVSRLHAAGQVGEAHVPAHPTEIDLAHQETAIIVQLDDPSRYA